MANKIIFTNVSLLSFQRTSKEASAKLSAAFNDQIIKAMAWAEVPECLSGGSLDGKLNATSCRLEPNEKSLRAHGIDLDLSMASDFSYTRLELEGKKGRGHRLELRFKITLADNEACAKLERYLLTIGPSPSKLSINHAVQTTLEMQAEDGDSDQAEMVQ